MLGGTQVIADGRQNRFERDELAAFSLRQRRRARTDPRTDDRNVFLGWPLCNATRRHFAFDHSLEQERLVGLLRREETRLGQFLHLQDVEVASLRARTVVAAQAVSPQDGM